MHTRYRILIVTRGTSLETRSFVQVLEVEETGSIERRRLLFSETVHKPEEPEAQANEARTRGIAWLRQLLQDDEALQARTQFVESFSIYPQRSKVSENPLPNVILDQLRSYANGDGPAYVEALESVVRSFAYSLDAIAAGIQLEGIFQDFPASAICPSCGELASDCFGHSTESLTDESEVTR